MIGVNYPKKVCSFLFDLDGVFIQHPTAEHQRLDYARLKHLKKNALELHRALNYDLYGDSQREISLDFDSFWRISNPYNTLSTDLSFVLSAITRYHKIENARDWEIKAAKELIKDADIFYKREMLAKFESEYYEHDPNMVHFIHKLANQNPNVPFFINSGNSRYLAEQKIKAVGLQDVFMKNGSLPDFPIYGEDIMYRQKGIEWLHTNKIIKDYREKTEVLFCDRPGDPEAVHFLSNHPFIVYFGNPVDPITVNLHRDSLHIVDESDSSDHEISFRDPSFLEHLTNKGLVLYLSNEMSDFEKVQKLEEVLLTGKRQNKEGSLKKTIEIEY